MPTNDPLIKGYEKVVDDEGIERLLPIRYMTLDEIKERADLNIANTASAQRARVVKELAEANGSSNGNGNGHKNGFSARI